MGWGSITNFEYSSGDVILNTLSGKTLVLDEEVYDDIQFSIATGRVPAAYAPTWAAFGTNTNKYTFAINDYIDLQSQELNHCYKEGTDVQWHLHIYHNGAVTGDRTVRYILYYGITNNNGTYSESTITQDITIPDGTADKTHLIYDLGAAVTGTNFDIGADITVRIERGTPATGTAPASDPFLSMVGLHIAKDTLGSRQIITK